MDTTNLEAIAETIVQWLQGLGDQVAQQAPLLAQEVLRYGFWEAILYTVVAFAFMGGLIGLGLFIKARMTTYYANTRYRPGDDMPSWIPLLICGGFSCIPFAVAVGELVTIIQIVVAPRLYLLNEVARLVR